MPQWFWLLLPPLVGAIIGLFTNWLAIKMLFRPRYEKRILGLRIPFTPGILPRERKRLAASLGETAAGDLLTEDVLVAKISSGEFKGKLQSVILAVQNNLYATRFSAIQAGSGSLVSPLVKDILKQSLQSLGQSTAFKSAAERAISQAIEEISEIQLDGGHSAENVLHNLITEHNCQQLAFALLKAFEKQLQQSLEQGACPADFVNPPEAAMVERLFHYSWPLISAKVVEILKQKKIRRTLEKTGAVLVRRIIERLNSVQRFFMGLGGYDRRILETMPDIIDDFVESAQQLFEKPETKAEILEWVQAAINDFMHKPLSSHDLVANQDSRTELISKSTDFLAAALLSLRNDRTIGQLAEYLRQHTLGDIFHIFPQLKPVLTVAASAWLAKLFLDNSQSGRSASRVLHGFFDEFLARLEEQPLGDYLLVSDEQAGQLAELAADTLAGLAAIHSAHIIQSVDVRGLVEDRVNELDIESVERMILRVMDKELKAVTWFGALLGGLLGLVQSLINLLR